MSWLPAAIPHPHTTLASRSKRLYAPLTNLNRHVIISAEVLMPQRNADTACSHSQLVKVHIFLWLSAFQPPASSHQIPAFPHPADICVCMHNAAYAQYLECMAALLALQEALSKGFRLLRLH